MASLEHIRAQATLEALIEHVRGRLPSALRADVDEFVRRTEARLVEAVASRLPELLYFASGTNHPGEIRGFAGLGHPVGVSALQVGEDALAALQGAGVPVFVDSGAFGEKPSRPFGPATWNRIFGVYDRLAAPGTYLVAPDKVGDQAESLRRLDSERWRLLPLRAAGATIIVPLQRGALSILELYDQVIGLVGDADFVVGIPGNKVALDEQDLLPLLRRRRCRGLHVLGMGPRNRRAPQLVAFTARHAPQAALSMDSNLRLAHLGQGRKLTAAEAAAKSALLEAERRGHPGRHADGFGLPDYTDAIGTPSGWTTERQRRRIALSSVPRRHRTSFVLDPDQHLGTHCAEERAPWCPELEDAIEEAWSSYWARAIVAERKAAGIRAAFGASP